MAATITITQSEPNLPSNGPVKHSYPPTNTPSIAALDHSLNGVIASVATAAAPDNNSTSQKTVHCREKIVFVTMCGALFLAGWNDGTTGPLLPRIQEVYHVRAQTHLSGDLSLTSSLPRSALGLCPSFSLQTAWCVTWIEIQHAGHYSSPNILGVH
jgi:hypothetical protein